MIVRQTIVLFVIIQVSTCVTVYKSSLTSLKTDNISGLHYLKEPNQTTPSKSVSFTVCVRINYKSLLDAHVLFFHNKQAPYNAFLWLPAMYPTTWWGFGNFEKGKRAYSNWILKDPERNDFFTWTTTHWHHVCISYDKNSSVLSLVKDGKVYKNDNSDNLNKVEFPEDFLDSIYVGRCPLGCSDHLGRITDFNLWDYALNVKDMKDWTTCGQFLKGNFISWEESKWNASNMVKEDWSYDKICLPDRLGLVPFSIRRNFTSSKTLCNSIKGTLPWITDSIMEENVQEIIKNETDCESKTWIDLWDNDFEGRFVSAQRGTVRPSVYQNWGLGEPNGDRMENCVVQRDNGWNDLNCDEKVCHVCNVSSIPIFTMRGLCFGSSFDHHYAWTGNRSSTGFYSFKGFSKSTLEWNPMKKEWILSVSDNPDVIATCNQTRSMYPLGTYDWYFFNDTCPRSEQADDDNESARIVQISLTGCTINEFPCRDGTW